MNGLALAYVAAGGAFGALCRYALMDAIGRIGGAGGFPYGTFAVNIIGAFLLGVWLGIVVGWLPERSRDLHALVAIGALGGFTTFSAFTLDAFLLLERGLLGQAVFYIVGSVMLSLLALLVGMWLMRSLI